MFADSFLPNLALFVAGQAAAWFYLRSGRLWPGGLAMAVLWITADWAVVARYVYDRHGSELALPLAIMQGTALLACAALAFAQWRRRWSPTAKRRTELFAAAQQLDLRGDRAAARTGFRRLLRNDPWDAAAWVALGNVLRGGGEQKRAARCYRRAVRVDATREYAELCALYLKDLAAGPAARPPVTSPRPQPTALAEHPVRS